MQNKCKRAIYAPMTIQVRLTDLLEARGKTIYWLAKQAETDFSTLYRIRDGKARGIRFDLLARVCEALECQPGDLLELADGKPRAKRTIKRKG